MRLLASFFRFALVSLSVVFLGCDNQPDTEPPTVQLLTLTVDASYPTKWVDNWVMVHDSKGVLLDARKFESGQVVTLGTQDVVPEGQISVTLLSFDSTLTGGNSVILDTYSHLPHGQEWSLLGPLPASTPGTYQGQFAIDIDGVQDIPRTIAVSQESQGLINGSYKMLNPKTMRVLGFPLEEKGPFMVSLETEFGYPRYLFLENVVNGGNYQVSVDDFRDFDHAIDVDFPAAVVVSCELTTLDPSRTIDSRYKSYNDTGYALYDDSGFELYFALWVKQGSFGSPLFQRQNLHLGYLDRFEKYCLDINFVYDGSSYIYVSRGAFPKAIDFPFDVNFGLQNTSLNALSLAGSPSYTRLSSNYQVARSGPYDAPYASWTIRSPQLGFKFLEFPSVVTDTYPFLDVNAFEHTSTTFVPKGRTYTDFIGATFKGVTDAYEEYSISVSK